MKSGDATDTAISQKRQDMTKFHRIHSMNEAETKPTYLDHEFTLDLQTVK